MRSDEELRAFLRDELAPRLAHWRGQLPPHEPLLRGPGELALCAGAVLAALLLRSEAPLGLPLLVVGGRHLRALGRRGRLLAAMRQDVLGRVVAFLAPGLQYQARGAIPADVVRRSGLFREPFDHCTGEDLFVGRVGATALRFSEIRLTRARGEKKPPETVFRGLFFVADFPKAFQGRVLLLPDRAERAMGTFGRAFQRLAGAEGLALVELEDPEFERHFACYGSDPVETRYLLSPSLMQRLLRFRENVGVPLRLAFADGSLLLALPHDGDLFTASWTGASFDEAALRRFAGELGFATGIVEEFDLDTRIWSKAPPRSAAASA